MDTALVVITLVSVGLTAALVAYAARLKRDERERSQARVAALAAEIGDGPQGAAHAVGAPEPLTLPPADAAAARALFAAEATTDDGTGSRRLLTLLVGVVVVGVVLAGAYVAGGHARATSPESTAAVARPLELTALGETRSGTGLVVSGAVRNPTEASAWKGLVAVVFAFDAAGALVTSGRAPIDYQVLAPGDESPFTVQVPNAANAVRYRVSFRAGADIVGHVDRRDRPRTAAD